MVMWPTYQKLAKNFSWWNPPIWTLCKVILNSHVLSSWSNGSSLDQLKTIFVVPGSNPVWNTPFFQKSSFGGIFCISKCHGSAVAKFVLMINTHMVNRVNWLQLLPSSVKILNQEINLLIFYFPGCCRTGFGHVCRPGHWPQRGRGKDTISWHGKPVGAHDVCR